MGTKLKLSEALLSNEIAVLTPEERRKYAEIEGVKNDFSSLLKTEPPPIVTPLKPKKDQPKEDAMWEPVITCMESVIQEEIMWLWPGYIALRKLAFIEGDPSHGKTWLTLAIAAAVSRGWSLPDPITGRCILVPENETQNVIYLTAEDGLGDTIKPRLISLGADCNHIYVIEGQRQEGKEMEPVTMQDLDILRQALEEVRPALLIIDPLQGFLGSGVDMHRANETRPVLSGMMRLAEEFNCAVVIIRHLNKSSGGKASYRGMGSIDFTAAARTVLLVGKDPEDEHRRIVLPTKCNVGFEGVPIAFTLTPDVGFQWAGKVDISAEDLLYPVPKDEQNQEKNRLDEAVDFLQDILAEGAKQIRDIKKEAEAAGIGWRTIERAKERLGFHALKAGTKWYWPAINAETTPPHFDVGGLGGLPARLTELGDTERPPRPPNKNNDGLDLWLEVGREIDPVTLEAKR